MHKNKSIAFLLIGICAALAGVRGPVRAEEKPAVAAAAKPSFYLITDYLPAAVYDGDSLTACFRVENMTGAETTLEFQQNALDENGKVLHEQTESVKIPATGFAQIQKTQDSNHCGKIQYTLRKGQEAVASAAVRLLRTESAWPAAKFRDGRLEATDNGDVLVALVRKRLKVQNRAFAPLRWMTGSAQPAQAAAGQKLTCIPGRWQLNPAKFKQDVLTLGPYAANGAAPLLAAVDQILNKVSALHATPAGSGSPTGPRVVLCLPPEDLDVATDPRVYRTVLEVLLARLENAGIKQVVMVPPLHFGANETYSQALWHEVHEAAATYQVRSVDPSEYLDEKLWRVDPAEAGVYGLRPNAAGLEKLEQGVADLLP